MPKSAKQSLIIVLILALMAIPFCSVANDLDSDLNEKITAEKMAADAIFVRPLGVVTIIVGSALFAISLPFSALGGNTQEAFDKMVKAPAKYTFERPLGDFDTED
jgi:hypothetical protein